MTGKPVTHGTVIVERTFSATPARVFAAWSDPKQRQQWDIPSEGWVVAEYRHDFRIGGEEYNRFGPKESPQYIVTGTYLDIVPDQRIVSAGTMHFGDLRSSSTLFTLELTATASGTRVKMTDQSVYYGGGEEASDRNEGWNEIADRLERFLSK